MEWHFDSKKDAKKLSKLLKTLEEGKIKRDYKPYQFDWAEEEEKIYIMFYLAQIKRGGMA
ncbi:MAG: hypothetical protein HC803_10175 [Saprospiraceae bacterium]|nr:hypothetical protein [Saprospiraceae bacterium]